jgi:nitrate/TMAO reductase-like tetraheme cytochrome c subunit
LFGGLLAVAGLAIGAGLMIGSMAVNRYTSTDEFCMSCHAMAALGTDPHYVQSAHQANSAGVRVGCGDCHIPHSNWFAETYAHAVDGMRDEIAQLTHNYNDPTVWEPRRVVLADVVREAMRRDDSAACRDCHDPATIKPTSEAGRAAHALLGNSQLTCIDCHINLVHAPVPPTTSFIRGSGLGEPRK